MVPPLPRQLLTQTAAIQACTGTDKWKEQTTVSYIVHHVHLQDSNSVRKTVANTEVVLRAILYVDARRSTLRSIGVSCCARHRQPAGM